MNTRTYKFAPPSEERPDPELVIKYVFKGDIDTLRDYLTIFPEVVDMREPVHGNVGIHIASSKGNIHLLSLFLSKGASINTRDMFGNTALHYAVDKSRKESVIWLITNGANINLQDFRGNSPLHVACTNNDIEMVRLLLNRNADPNLTDLANLRPIEKTNLQTIQKLIELKIEELHSKTDVDGSTQTVNWMSFGVGLGVGMGMALAKRQQAMIEQYMEQKRMMDGGTKHGRSVKNVDGSREGSAVLPFSPQALQLQQRVPTHNNSSLIVHQNTSTPNLNNTRTATSDRKFL